MTEPPTIAILSAEDVGRHLQPLGGLLHACVHGGASIGFILPFSPADGVAFWREAVWPAVRSGRRTLLVAWEGGRIAGSVQLDTGTPANQPHRAEVSKLLVHPDRRRRGIARTLMTALEDRARRHGRRLLTLDTRTGDHAEPLYASLGYETAGTIPGYCRDTVEDRFDATTIMYKVLPTRPRTDGTRSTA